MTIQDVDKNLAESFGLKRPRGALLVQVAEDGPADKAGLEAGDIIVTFDGHDIPSSADLPHVVGLVTPDTVVPVEIVRDNANVPHILGASDADVFFGLGYAHAQDRLLQLVVLRRTAQGQMLQRFGGATQPLLGPIRFVQHDR